MKRMIVAAIAIFTALPCTAQTHIVFCSNLVGSTVEENKSSAVEWSSDGMKDTSLQFEIDLDRTQAKLTVRNPSQRYSDVLEAEMLPTSTFVTFLVKYPKAVWLYTYYPHSRKLAATRHTDSIPESDGRLLMSSFVGQCVEQ